MKDEKRVEWVDVTGEYTVDRLLIEGSGIAGATVKDKRGKNRINVRWNGLNHFSTVDNCRAKTNNDGSIRIERRVEVEQPELVTIQTKDRDGGVLGTRRISYQSAKELGLI